MTEKEAIYILRNAAWLGSNEERQKLEEAVEVVAKAIEAQGRFGKDTNVPSNNILRHPSCKNRTSLGNCDPVGGFCSSVPKDICAKYYVSDTNVGDMISRQAAINAINTWDKFGADERSRVVRWHEGLEPYVHLRDVVAAIGNLPPAQPEIIRCKYCKHSEHWYWDKRRCFLWHETGIDVFEDGYCNYAKRRIDADMRGKQDDYEKKDIPLNTDDIFDAELAKRIMNNK